jgi:hypothetical protein
VKASSYLKRYDRRDPPKVMLTVRRGKVRANIWLHGELVCLGDFETKEAAARACVEAASRHGEFVPIELLRFLPSK